FQAEDGIRDKLVTGVQTCALPISSSELRSTDLPAEAGSDDLGAQLQSASIRSTLPPMSRSLSRRDFLQVTVGAGAFASTTATPRSEERRVGKEVRPRWQTDQQKNK